jgi:hypothetical protein
VTVPSAQKLEGYSKHENNHKEDQEEPLEFTQNILDQFLEKRKFSEETCKVKHLKVQQEEGKSLGYVQGVVNLLVNRDCEDAQYHARG